MSIVKEEKKTLAGFQVKDEKGKVLTYNFITNKWQETGEPEPMYEEQGHTSSPCGL